MDLLRRSLHIAPISTVQQSERGSCSKEEICSKVNREDISQIFFKIEKVLNDLFVDFNEIFEAINDFMAKLTFFYIVICPTCLCLVLYLYFLLLISGKGQP